MIQEAYVSLSTAKLLKEKRFNEPCYSFYEFKNRLYHHEMDTYFPNGMTNADHDKEGNNGIAAPTQLMAMRWLREEHKINIEIRMLFDNWDFCVQRIPNHDGSIYVAKSIWKSYEGACNAALHYCLENLI